eukprot:TRINITY_DN2617_c0_g1_i2.p1 TRINITY_DN2617_c0_g1~~TRINITY_DN2617_c0_g1_i2.p1  ORF type:complete len:273 (-),score=14.43 TRINITY_DN2617_c0_g1_i2:190-1008(-)
MADKIEPPKKKESFIKKLMMRPSSGKSGYDVYTETPARRMMLPSSGKSGYDCIQATVSQSKPVSRGAIEEGPSRIDPLTQTQLSVHPHQLSKTNAGQIFPNGDWQCQHCSNSTTIGMKFSLYHCSSCAYSACSRCVVSFRPIHDHVLKVIEDTTAIYPETGGHWCCDVCRGQTTEGLVSYMHHCSQDGCNFDVCDKCLNPKDYLEHHPPKPAEHVPGRVGMLHVTSGRGETKVFNLKPPMNPRGLEALSKEELEEELRIMRIANHDSNLQFF